MHNQRPNADLCRICSSLGIKGLERRCDGLNQNCEEEKENGFDWTTNCHDESRR
jgi:hypothetical protein